MAGGEGARLGDRGIWHAPGVHKYTKETRLRQAGWPVGGNSAACRPRLRSVIDLKGLGENTLWLDCDVIQADGGTRTASITGAYVALVDAVGKAKKAGLVSGEPITGQIAAISVGIVDGVPVLDLDYKEDVDAGVDMNVAMLGDGSFVEVQGTGEHATFTIKELNAMLKLAIGGIEELHALQKRAWGGNDE